MDYRKICNDCIDCANNIKEDYEKFAGCLLNCGERIENPYGTIYNNNSGKFTTINEICTLLCGTKYMGDLIKIFNATNRMIDAFCEIIGEEMDDYPHLDYDDASFWVAHSIRHTYDFSLYDMWMVVSSYDRLLKLYENRLNIEKAIKEWYPYMEDGSLTDWLFAVYIKDDIKKAFHAACDAGYINEHSTKDEVLECTDKILECDGICIEALNCAEYIYAKKVLCECLEQ